LLIFSDGGARGNPGPAAIAFKIKSEEGRSLASDASCIGTATNNQAEYKALLAALEVAASLKPEKVTCYLDSELVVKQLLGEYRVKDAELKHFWNAVQEYKGRFVEIRFVNVPRTHQVIREVDDMVNLALDKGKC
jgi:ribonuclease HI